MGVVAQPFGHIVKKLVAAGVDLIRILMDVEFSANLGHRIPEILSSPIDPGFLLPVNVIHGEGEKGLSRPMQRTAPHHLG